MGDNQSKKFKLYLVDAFTSIAFRGNPAAVCLLDEPIPDQTMLSIAAEMNVSETAFVLPKAGEGNTFSLRWFTPVMEMPLCGHPTLAASMVLFDDLSIPYDKIVYETQGGTLIARKDPLGIVLDFPLDKPTEANFPQRDELLEAMGIVDYQHIFLGEKTKKLVIHLHSTQDVHALAPNFERMKLIAVEQIKGVGVTAYGNMSHCDCVTRYFNPWAGVNEDPVTGSVHTLLGYYWSKFLHKEEIHAYQASRRGGEMVLRIKNPDRIEMIGKAVITLKGDLYI